MFYINPKILLFGKDFVTLDGRLKILSLGVSKVILVIFGKTISLEMPLLIPFFLSILQTILKLNI